MSRPKNPANNWAPTLEFAKQLFELKTEVKYKYNGMEAKGVKIKSLTNSNFNYFVGTKEEYKAKVKPPRPKPTARELVNENIKDLEFRELIKRQDQKGLFK